MESGGSLGGDGVGQDHWHAVAISAMSGEPAYWMRKGYPFMRGLWNPSKPPPEGFATL